MLYLKILIMVLTSASALVALNLDHVWHENPLRKKQARVGLYIVTFLLLLLGTCVLIYDERSSDQAKQSLNNQLLKLTSQNDTLILTSKEARAEQAVRYDELVAANKELQAQLQPFVSLAREKYPSSDINKSLQNLQTELSGVRDRTSKLEAAEVAKRARVLTDTQISALVKSLSRFKGIPIGIKYRANDTESLNYAQQFKQIFESSGWSITGVAMTFYYKPVYGLELGIKNDSSSEPVKAILSAFEQLGVTIKPVVYSGQTEGVILRVGQK